MSAAQPYQLPSADAIKETVEAREEKIRSDWVKVMKARIVREELVKCHKGEGVNHYQVCQPLADRYLELLKDAKVRGYKHVDLA
ncbi:nadh-ubiquinone oxidoreductase 12 kda subunit [Ceraceosorus bombacis]|uniref:Nadh-ubiquinone oxidoreductase 12 kDa subunit n=1 Tax=Ceraceosorus bombacis TaxID=401625 RepID=A0A0P1BAR7_9BASI|nr:nadh-ubiquinone oxidoreductase 12 kda subunit [Ceraceosorus bombacis]